MKKQLLVFALIVSSILTNCSPSSEKRVEEAENKIERGIKDEKEEITKDLQNLRNDINDKLDRISKELEDANGSAQAELESVKSILLEHRTRVESALNLIDQSADDSFDNAQQEAKNTYSEVKLGCEQLKDRYDNAVKNVKKD